MSLIQTVDTISKFFNIPSVLNCYQFSTWGSLDKTRRGVYVITDRDSVNPDVKYIYVGKGFFRARQKTHWRKLVNSADFDPKGWKWFVENHVVNLDQWQLYLIDLPQETQLSAMEGALIHLLQPLANDETFVDRINN